MKHQLSQRKTAILGSLLAAWVSPPLFAVPPLVSGDVPTAEKGTIESYSGAIYETDSGGITRELPTTELVFGISDRQEVTFEIPYLSIGGEHGFGDAVFGTKYRFIDETERIPQVSATFELTVPTGSASRGLGNDAYDFDLRIPAQKTWGKFTALGNIGGTFLGDPRSNRPNERREHKWFTSAVGEYAITEKTRLLAEVYLETAEERGQPNRFAAEIGIEQEIVHDLTLQAAVGRSLRDDRRGGPDLRVYVGLHWVFDAPWKPKKEHADK